MRLGGQGCKEEEEEEASRVSTKSARKKIHEKGGQTTSLGKVYGL